MRYIAILFSFTSLLFAQNASVATLSAPISYSGSAIYPIDPMNRGVDIVNMIATLSTGIYNLTNSEIAILTTRNGLIRYVMSSNVYATPYHTILIIGSLPSRANIPSNLTFYIIPVEQIVEVVYSPYSSISPSATFSASMTTGVIPIFPINLTHRAADLIDVFSRIKANASYYRYQSKSSFKLQTSLFGSYPLAVNNGVINNVQCVSLSPPTSTPCGSNSGSSHSTLLFITYNTTPNNLVNPYYIVASPDQIYGITYTP